MPSKPIKTDRKNDPFTGIIHMTAPDRGGDKAPLAKGFVGLSKEMLRVLLEQEEDNYGSIKIEVAVWAKDNQPGVLSGKAQLPYAIRKQMEEGTYGAPASYSTPEQALDAAGEVGTDDILF